MNMDMIKAIMTVRDMHMEKLIKRAHDDED